MMEHNIPIGHFLLEAVNHWNPSDVRDPIKQIMKCQRA